MRSTNLVLGGLVAVPLLFVACAPASRSDDPSNSQTDDVVTEGPNDKVAFDYFVGQGLTAVQAAGIVGNLDQESGMSPTIAQIGGGPGRGIAQWSVGGRWDTDANDNVAWYAAKQGASMDSLQLQLEFIWYELTTLGYGDSELRAATTVTAATDAFMTYYEICGACDATNRVAHAEAALADFGGSAPPPTTGTSCTASGVSGTCIETTTCQSMGYVSTAGLCPGAADIECCTPPASHAASSSSTSGSTTASSSSGGTGGSGTSSSGGGGTGGGSGTSSGGTGGAGGSASAPSCSVNGTEGTCIATSECAAMTGYTSTPGFCAGPAAIECCTPPVACTVNGVAGACIDTSLCAANGGTSTPGYCPGAASEECCTM